MTRPDVAALLERTVIARGLPQKVNDPVVLGRAAAAFRQTDEPIGTSLSRRPGRSRAADE